MRAASRGSCGFSLMRADNVWPGMNYYRHLALVSPLVHLFLAFIAGAGLQTVFSTYPSRYLARRLTNITCVLYVVLLSGLGIWLVDLARNPDRSGQVIASLIDTRGLPPNPGCG